MVSGATVARVTAEMLGRLQELLQAAIPKIGPQPADECATALERAWREAPRAYAALRPDVFQRLSEDGLPMNVLARDTRRVIVARR